MPDGPSLPDATKPPELRDQAQQQMAGWLDVANLQKASKWAVSAAHEILVDVLSFLLMGAAKFGALVVGILARAEDKASPEFGELAAAAVSDLFGVSNPGGAAMTRGNRGGRTGVSNDVGDMLFRAFAGNASAASGGELTPTDAPAKAFLSTMSQLALEGWLEGWIAEACSLGQLETFGDLDDTISHVLGLGRASAAVHGPLVRDLIVTPLEWKLNRDHRPTLLTAAAAVQQILRGSHDAEVWREDLRRQGYSDKRIAALLNQGRKFFSPADVRTFYARGEWTGEQAEQHLRDQGYDADAAHDALRLEGLKRFDQLETQEANSIISAYAARDIDRSTFLSMLNAAVQPEAERALLTELGDVRRAANVTHLSISQVETMVKSGVLNVRDYRLAAERAGYPDDEVTALELQLRYELDRDKAIAEHRAALEAERAAERQARADAAAKRKADIDAERALQRRGSEADLERAVVRGLIPIARLEEVYRAHYDDDAVNFLVDLVESDRAAYVTQQQARDDAAKRAARRNVDVGAVESAYHAGVISIDELRARFAALGFDDADTELLASTAAARQADLDAAAEKRRQAEAAAEKRSIDLPRFEQLVRRGRRTFAQYDELLASLGFDEASRAAMRELLELKVADDEKARQARADAERELAPRGLSLEQIRRAVLLGIRTEDDFSRFLVENRFTADAQIVLLEELRADVAEADAARRRRESADPGPQAPGIPLSTVRRAAQLGLIPVPTYVERLQAIGWSDDDIAIEVDLLVQEIADVQAKRATADAPAPANPDRALSLADLARAVKAGGATVDEYKAQAITLGYSSADAELLGDVLERERSTLAAARARHDEIAFTLAAAGADLAALEAQVKSGDLEVADYVAQLETWGSDEAEAELLGALLTFTLGKS